MSSSSNDVRVLVRILHILKKNMPRKSCSEAINWAAFMSSHYHRHGHYSLASLYTCYNVLEPGICCNTGHPSDTHLSPNLSKLTTSIAAAQPFRIFGTERSFVQHCELISKLRNMLWANEICRFEFKISFGGYPLSQQHTCQGYPGYFQETWALNWTRLQQISRVTWHIWNNSIFMINLRIILRKTFELLELQYWIWRTNLMFDQPFA